MQENEFEKKLQQKLETLQVQPTAEVWQKVQLQVAQKKKKRRFAFFFLLAFMLSTGAWVTSMLLNIPGNDTTAGKIERAKDTKAMPPADELNDTKFSANESAFQEIQKASNAESKTAPAAAIEVETADTKTVNNKPIDLRGKTDRNTTAVLNPLKKNTKARLSVATTNPAVEEDQDKTVQKNVAEKETSPETITKEIAGKERSEVAGTVSEAVNETTEKDSVVKEMAQQVVKKESEPGKAVAAAKEKKRNTNDRTWGIGFSFSAGLNKVGNNGVAKSLLEDYNNGGVSGNPNTPTAGLNSNAFSPMQPGSAFATGIHVYRKLGHSLKLTMGLQYNYSSLASKTGKRIDTTAAVRFEIYRPGSSVTYTNRYHYLTIPISLSAKLFSIGNREIVMDAGASLSQLVGTNALSYNSAQERYFTGANDLNKTVLSLSGALAINLAGNNQPAFYIGPQVNYALTPLAPAGLHRGMRPLFIGIRLQKNIWK